MSGLSHSAIPKASSHKLGTRGEEIAQSFLRCQGFRINALNWRLGRSGEIDVIAYHPQQDLLVFVEVKTRRGQMLGNPLEAVDQRKVEQLLLLAEAYLGQNSPMASTTIRFDVIGVCFSGAGQPAEITHLENAFGSSG